MFVLCFLHAGLNTQVVPKTRLNGEHRRLENLPANYGIKSSAFPWVLSSACKASNSGIWPAWSKATRRLLFLLHKTDIHNWFFEKQNTLRRIFLAESDVETLQLHGSYDTVHWWNGTFFCPVHGTWSGGKGKQGALAGISAGFGRRLNWFFSLNPFLHNYKDNSNIFPSKRCFPIHFLNLCIFCQCLQFEWKKNNWMSHRSHNKDVQRRKACLRAIIE